MDGQDEGTSDPLTLDIVDRLLIEQYERHDTQVALVRRLLTKEESITEVMRELVEVECNLNRLRHREHDGQGPEGIARSPGPRGRRAPRMVHRLCGRGAGRQADGVPLIHRRLAS